MALSDNLVAYYSFEEVSGGAIDAHGSNDLDETSGTIDSATGKIGNCRDIEVSQSEVFNIADNAALSITGNLTIQIWVRFESLNNNRGILGKYSAFEDNRGYALDYVLSSNTFRFIVSSDGITTTSVTSTNFGAPSNGTWYHIVAVHDADNDEIRIYINAGTPDIAAHSTGIFDSEAQFIIGTATSGNSTSTNMDGLVDECGIWNRVLSDEEITELYNNGDGRDYNYIINGEEDEELSINKILNKSLLPSILHLLEDRKQIQYPVEEGDILERDYTFPLLYTLLKNKIGFNNPKFNIRNNLFKNTIGQIISEHNIDYDFSKNSIGQTNEQYNVNFNLNKNTAAQSNKYFNVRYNLAKNLQALISDNYGVHINLNDLLNATKNRTFNVDFDFYKNMIATIGSKFPIDYDFNDQLLSQLSKTFNLNFNLRKNTHAQSNKKFNIGFDILSNKNILGNKNFGIDINNLNPLIALINKKFNLNIDLRKNTTALIGPDFNITFGAEQNIAADNDFTFFLPLIFDLLPNKVGIINPRFNFDTDFNKQFDTLNNKIFNIDYNALKNIAALINPDFNVLFQQFKQTQSHRQVSYDIDFNLLYDILLVEAGGNTFLVDYVFSILFNLLSNKNALNHTNLGLHLDLNKNILFQKDRQFNIPLNIIQQGIRLKNSDLVVPLGGLTTNLDALKETLFNLDLDFNKQLTSAVNTEFETTFAIPKHIAANLNYQFPLVIEFSHDVETTTIISIVPDNIDDTLWCHVKTIRVNTDIKAHKIYLGVDKITTYGVEE